MSGRATVTRHAPGKLFVAGEYAVLEPGHPAILVAVDRQVSVTVSGSDGADGADVVVESDLCPAAVRLRRTDDGLAGDGPAGDGPAGLDAADGRPAPGGPGAPGLDAPDGRPVPDGLGHVVSAIDVVDQLLAEGGRRPGPIRVSISSRLHRDGTKFGLGSSGAVTVAAVTAVAAYHGVRLSPDARYRLAMLATARRDADAFGGALAASSPGGALAASSPGGDPTATLPTGDPTATSSGGDLAASVWGGWIAYHAPDRAAVLDLARRRGITETLRAPWPGFGLRRLPPPRRLALEVGWTGQPVSTSALTGPLGARRWWGSASQRSFLTRSDACVRAAIRALDRGDDRELLEQVRGARRVLAELDDEVRLGIFTTRLTALCDAAEAVGGAGKPSGAGGGDCGIALLDATAERDISHLRTAWAAAGVLSMPMHIQPTNGSAT